MAGRGPASDGRAIRRNKRPGFDVIEAEPAPQPKLPDVWRHESVYDEELGDWVTRRVKLVWPAQTKSWWKTWADSPLAAAFTTDDWTFLLDTALLHADYWSGNLKLAGEIRLRVAKYGQTPEDRQRLKIEFAPPQEKTDEEKAAEAAAAGARHRRGPLVMVSSQ